MHEKLRRPNDSEQTLKLFRLSETSHLITLYQREHLFRGKFGKVYRCREKATGLELAAKHIKIKRDADREKVEREVYHNYQ